MHPGYITVREHFLFNMFFSLSVNLVAEGDLLYSWNSFCKKKMSIHLKILTFYQGNGLAEYDSVVLSMS